MNLPLWVILVASFICNLSAKNRNESLFWWLCTWLLQRFKNLLCLFLHYPNRRRKHAFFPWLHAVFITPDASFHKCKPIIGKPSLKHNVKATSFWSFSALDGWNLGPLTWIPYFLPYQSQGRAHKTIHPKERRSHHFHSICILGPAAGHFRSYLVITKS